MTDQQSDFSSELRHFPIFQGLQPEQLRGIPCTRAPSVRPGLILFKQGELIQRLYFVLEGQVELLRTNERGEPVLRRIVGPGQVLGRLELDVLEGQLGTAKTLTNTQLLYIDRSVLQRLRNTVPVLANQLDRSEVIGHLRATPYFAPLTDDEVRWLSDIVTTLDPPGGAFLFRRGDAADNAYIIRQGRVRLERGGNGKTAWLSAGAVFGARSVVENRYRESNAVTETSCHLFVLPADDLRTVIQNYPQNAWTTDPTAAAKALAAVPFFSQLHRDELLEMAGHTMQLHFRQSHRIIVRQDQNDNYLYLLVRGRVTALVTDKDGVPGPLQTVAPGEAFGAVSVLLGEGATATVETLSPTDWFRIHRQDFALFLKAHPTVFDRLAMSAELRSRYIASLARHSWQQEGESMLLQTRRHWVVLARNLSGVIILFLLLLAFDYLVYRVIGPPPWWVQALFILTIPLPLALWVITDYLNDYYIVTSRRVARRDKVILISEKLSSAPLDKVQDIRGDRGFLARLFGYGHLRIATAGTWGEIRFEFAPRSQEFVSIIQSESTRAKIAAAPENQEAIRRQLQDRLHVGLEERVDRRALIEEIAPTGPAEARPRKFLFRALAGLEYRPDNRLVWRKHWLGLIYKLTAPVITTLLLAGLAAFALSYALSGNAVYGSLAFAMVIAVLIMLAGSAFWIWWVWTDWVNDLYIVSDQFIEHIEKKPLFINERTVVTSYERVQNVTYTKPNPLAYLFNFGHVLIQTAAENGAILFRLAPQPDAIQTEILRRLEHYSEAQAALRRKESESDMADWFEAYSTLAGEDSRTPVRR